jgi:hypothetical protein
MSSFVNSIEGSFITWTRSSGTANFLSASITSPMVYEEHLLAFGCGATITEFLPFNANMTLHIGVTIGLVLGVAAATTPLGFAISTMPAAHPAAADVHQSPYQPFHPQ